MTINLQILKFSIVGIANTAITVTCILFLTMAGFNLAIANVIGFSAGLINSYYFNRSFTFGAGRGRAIHFLAAFALAYSLNLGAVFLTGCLFQIHAITQQLAGMATYNVAFFILMRTWVFYAGK